MGQAVVTEPSDGESHESGAPPPRSNDLSPSQRLGLYVVIAIFATTVLIDLAVTALDWSLGKPIVVSLGRLALTLLLFAFVWLGMRWAQWTYVLLFAAAGGLAIGSGARMGAPLLVCMGLAYFAMAGCLAWLPAVQEFLRAQRQRRLARRALRTPH